ncbi:nucleoside transporter, NupC family [Bacteriovorax sp. BSW11_IV]|uniref:NupC/NupG family nucleoside CNT transporter n=1 Tax=Bacteriovorax sp. BSW11_IV TaxID=1353529 RepID=UPI00038A3F3C|nr:NupC/NupG family nucleoside CNT transporter [Bacteriovorax sp. BSW11_IV]EQC49972.1 nucleoside transporter, NupC family [Bacteriovorax sp. BSW11_IV]
MPKLISFIGLLSMIGVAFLLSKDKKNICWRTVLSGVALQLVLGLFILKTDIGRTIFEGARTIFTGFLNYTNEGSRFIFGDLVDSKKFGFIFFTMVLPTILFMSSFMSILYHIGIMQWVIKITAKVMVKVMGTSGAESLAAAANIFAGQTEAPLVIKPFIGRMTRSELLALMTGGMSTVAGGVLAAYVSFGIDAAHLLAASVMSAPAALVCAKLLMPESEDSVTKGTVSIQIEKNTANLVDAAASGASEGLKLALNVAAMLLSFIALIALFNGLLGWAGGLAGYPQLSLELITGYLFSPVAWIMGVPWADCMTVGSLLGKKLILNEFVAYLDLAKHLNDLSPRSVVISTYALCGFANFSSIAIQVGGIGALAPERRKDLALLGVRSLIGGTLACLMTACIAGILI